MRYDVGSIFGLGAGRTLTFISGSEPAEQVGVPELVGEAVVAVYARQVQAELTRDGESWHAGR